MCFNVGVIKPAPNQLIKLAERKGFGRVVTFDDDTLKDTQKIITKVEQMRMMHDAQEQTSQKV